MTLLTSEIADVSLFRRVKDQIANRCNQTVNAESDDAQEEVRQASGLPSVGLKAGVVDNDAADNFGYTDSLSY